MHGMSDLHEECGVVAIYHLPGRGHQPAVSQSKARKKSPGWCRECCLDVQNRGQLAAGMTTYNPERNQLLDTYKDVGSVSEVFRLNHRGKYESLMEEYSDGRRSATSAMRPVAPTTAAMPSRSNVPI